MNRRLFTTILLIPAILLLPYWLYVPGLVLAMAAFPLYWESLFLGFLVQALYGERPGTVSEFALSAPVLAALGLLILMPLRRRLRTHV